MSEGSHSVPLLDANRLSAVVFDMDGVVTDTARVHEAAWKRVFNEILERIAPQATPFRHEDYVAYVDGRNRIDGGRAFLESRGVDLSRTASCSPGSVAALEEVAARKDSYFTDAIDKLGPARFEDAVRLLDRLHAVGIRAALATASHHRSAVLERTGLGSRFEAIIDGVDIDELGLLGKPASDVFLEAVRRLGVEPGRAVVLEDAPAGIRAACAGEFAMAIGVDRNGNPAPLWAAGATAVVRSLDEIRVGGVR